MPWVELEDQTTHQKFYVSNTHDPADSDGNGHSGIHQAQWREKDVAVHLADAQKWVSSGSPVIMTGDFNWGYNIREGGPTSDNYYIHGDKAKLPYCLITKDNILFDAKDGKVGYCPSFTGQINGPGARSVDHILASKDLTVSGFGVFTNAAINSVTDHPGIITATIGMPGSPLTTPTGDQPTQTIVGVKNFRDAATNTNTLKTGVLYRSADLNGISQVSKQQLSELLGNTGTIIDLRTAEQRQSAPDPVITGSKKKEIPIQGILDQKPMVTDATRRAQIAKALTAAENANGPVLIHCTDGKDRTGWVVAMIMYNAGASVSEVMTEYMASSATYPGGVKEEWLNSGLNAIKTNYGSVRNYLIKGLGLSTNDLNKLNNKFGAAE
jgi:protein-tyrosine phosphatase